MKKKFEPSSNQLSAQAHSWTALEGQPMAVGYPPTAVGGYPTTVGGYPTTVGGEPTAVQRNRRRLEGIQRRLEGNRRRYRVTDGGWRSTFFNREKKRNKLVHTQMPRATSRKPQATGSQRPRGHAALRS